MKPDRREKFVELAEKRVNKAIKEMHLIGNLSNKSNYSYTEQDVRKIVAALRKSVDDVKARFERNASDGTGAFRIQRRYQPVDSNFGSGLEDKQKGDKGMWLFRVMGRGEMNQDPVQDD